MGEGRGRETRGVLFDFYQTHHFVYFYVEHFLLGVRSLTRIQNSFHMRQGGARWRKAMLPHGGWAVGGLGGAFREEEGERCSLELL